MTTLSPSPLSSVAGNIKFVFKALGWLLAEDGDKVPDSSHSVSALGVQIDVQNMHCGVVTIDTAGRKVDLLQILDDVILSKKLGQAVSPGSPSMWLPSMLTACVAWTLMTRQSVH